MDVLVDLDGTMTDPRSGIVASFRYALAALDCNVPGKDELDWVIGPPLRDSFPQLGVKPADVERALALYRMNYTGKGAEAGHAPAMYAATVYPGIASALAKLKADGHRLIVCTSKPHVYARPILGHFELAAHFAAIHGSELDGRNDDKADLIRHIVATEAVDVRHAIMIGDRKFDVLGARANGIPAIGVLWGYGSRAELADAGAAGLCSTPGELVGAVASLRRA
jgi:phosphoglycolate phosphatase